MDTAGTPIQTAHCCRLKSSPAFLLLFIKTIINYTEDQEITTGPGYAWKGKLNQRALEQLKTPKHIMRTANNKANQDIVITKQKDFHIQFAITKGELTL